MNVTHVQQTFHQRFPNSSDAITVSAPGRVNLIGEHTDYNDGFVMPMAIDSQIVLVGSRREDREVHLYSLDYEAGDQFDLDHIDSADKNRWTNYIRGVCAVFMQTTPLQGMNIVLQGDVPQGAGLSSSAALEVAAALLIRNLHGLTMDPVSMVKLAQKAENEFVGVQCGIMDQFISMVGKRDHVLFLDCRSLKYELVPAPFQQRQAKVVVIDSGVKRGLVDSAYNTRRSQCSQAVELLRNDVPGITALRDVSLEHLPLINALEEDLAKRARHVVTENHRVLEAITHLKSGDIEGFGQLMNASHNSLRDDYEVSCSELDLLVSTAQSVPGVYGSRMTGAGFGGCTVTVADETAVPALQEKILQVYPDKTGITPRVFLYNPCEGAHQH